MKKLPLVFVSLALLFSCGQNEESSTAAGNDVQTESDYGSSFEACNSLNQIEVNLEDLSSSDSLTFEEHLADIDISTFKYHRAELNMKHKALRIKFTNNQEILHKGIGSYGPNDFSLQFSFKPNEGEIVAGKFDKSHGDINLVKVYKVDNINTSKAIGSNKTVKEIVINKISEENVCGSITYSTEDGHEVLKASFDMPISIVPM